MSKANRKDIKKAIKAFIHRVETLENAEDPEINGFDAEYKLIQEAQIKNKRDNLFSMDVGKSDNNLKKNRYKDILPYDDHRVVLSVVEGDQASDYINASKLMGVRGTGGYIATQGPLAVTVIDFWRMIWEYNVEIIFMACRIVEMGKIKCKQYWNDLGKTEEYESITVFTEAEEKIMSDCVQRNFRVTKGEEVRHVIQYHYSGWPDHGIPDDAGHIRDMIGLMRQTRHNDRAPLLVHCSAGCGRTGAIIAIDYVWTLLEEGKFDDAFSLFDLICNFREQRMSIVQTADQYALVNKVLRSLCEEWLTRMASHTYENVNLDEVSDTDGSSSGVTSNSASGENAYENNGTTNNHHQEDDLVQSPDKSTFIEKRHVNELRENTHEATHTSEGNKGNLSSAYTNVLQGEGGHQVDMVPQHLPARAASNEWPAHRSNAQADLGSPTKQAQTSDLGGPPESVYSVLHQTPAPSISPGSVYSVLNDQIPASSISPKPLHPVFNGPQTKVRPPQPLRPHVADIFTYSTVDDKGSKSPSEDSAAYSIVNKKSSKAPSPPGPPIKQLYPQEGPVYSVVNKSPPLKSPGVASLPSPTLRNPSASDDKSVYSVANKSPPLKSPGVAFPSPKLSNPSASDDKSVYSIVNKTSPLKSPGVASFPSPTLRNPSASDDKSVYSLARDSSSGSVFTPYEVISFPGNPNRNVSSSSMGVSGGRISSSSSSIIQSLGQINLGNVPGFKERLPRVKGPVPMPQTWNKI